ncbi:MAG: dethiobiotin synthase [Planctomycetota bacterium]
MSDEPSSLDRELEDEQRQRHVAGLARTTMLDGRINGHDFGSNDYLGLAQDPAVVDAMASAAREYGAGGRSARLLRGGTPLHEQAEAALASWLGCESSLLFPSGYQANLGLVGALVGRGDAILSDRANHASLIDAARLSRAQVLVHDHCDLVDLERVLRAARGARRRLVLTEGVFSMGGDVAPLLAIEQLCRQYDAWLVVDEAHSIGVLGEAGAGAWAAALAQASCDARPDAQPAQRLCARVVTCGKALGMGGAFVAGSTALRTQLIHTARSFLFTTAPPPVIAGGLLAAIARCRKADDARLRLRRNVRRLAQQLQIDAPPAAIVPVVVGAADRAHALAQQLEAEGFYAPAVRPPTVPPGQSQLRVVCHAQHQERDIDALAARLLPHVSRAPAAVVDPASCGALANVVCVAGTDTGVGKTVASALLLRAAMRRGLGCSYWKPVQTGDLEDDDTRTVGQLCGASSDMLLPKGCSYALPASPHEAAASVGERVHLRDLERMLSEHRQRLPDRQILIELAGGIHVPFDLEPPLLQSDWLQRLAAPVVLVARSGLGTLNHTLLTFEALRARRVHVAALLLVGPRHASNRRTLAQLAAPPRLLEVPPLEPLDTAALDRWLDQHDLHEVFEDA